MKEKISIGILILLIASFLTANLANAEIIRGGEDESTDFIDWQLRTFEKTDEYKRNPWRETTASDEFYNKLGMNSMVNDIESKVANNTNLEIHPIYIKVYEKPHLSLLSKFLYRISKSAEETNYNGVIIYWTDYGVFPRSFSPRISNKELREIRDEAWSRSYNGETGNRDYREGIKYLLEETAKQIASEVGRTCDPDHPKDCGAAEGINCNPITADAGTSSKYKCCPGAKRWNGEKCVEMKGSSCNDVSECASGMDCNSKRPEEIFGGDGIQKHCCPEDTIWDGNSCSKGFEGYNCSKDPQCKKRGILDGGFFKSDLYCNPALEEADLSMACCPEGAGWNGEECVDKKGEPCEAENCPAGMECYSTFPREQGIQDIRKKVEKACCPEDKIWNGENCVKGKNGDYCKRDSQCKGDKNCNSLPYTDAYSACCPGDKVWDTSGGDGGKCVKMEGIPCGEEKYGECPGEWECTQINPDIDKGCCPPDKKWNGKSCVKEGGGGMNCSEDEDCRSWAISNIAPDFFNVPHDLNCNPATSDSSLEKACCTGRRIWNGEECVDTIDCEDHSDCNREGWTCNSVDPENIKKHCCPEDLIWNGRECLEARETQNCARDSQCLYLKGGLRCRPVIGDWSKGACCPPNQMYDPDTGKCKKADRGDRCPDEAYCNSKEENLNCNPSTTYISEGDRTERYCCAGDQVYDTEKGECTYLDEGKECMISSQCKSGLNCYYTLENNDKVCCPPDHRWNGEKCVQS